MGVPVGLTAPGLAEVLGHVDLEEQKIKVGNSLVKKCSLDVLSHMANT